MADTLASLVVKLIGDTTGFRDDMAEGERIAGQFTENLRKHSLQVTAIGAGMTAGLTLPIVAGFKSAMDAASDMSETTSKVGVVFDTQAESVMAWSQTSATAMGMSQQSALDAAGTYGNLFVSMGLTDTASSSMSTHLVQLAGDLASFNNMAGSDVLEKLRAGLTGEAEPLKALGVNINAATIEAKALSLGLVQADVDLLKVEKAQNAYTKAMEAHTKAVKKYGEDSQQAKDAQLAMATAEQAIKTALAGKTPELTAAQKAQAAYALIMEQTKTAQGDFARTSDGLANSQRIMQAEFDNAAASLGTNLLPIGLQIVTFVKDLLAQFNALDPGMKQTIVTVGLVVAAIGPLLTIVGGLGTAFATIGPIVGAVIAVLSGPLLPVIATVGAAMAVLKLAWDNDWGGIREKVAAAVEFVTGVIQSIVTFLQAHKLEVQGVLEGLGLILKGPFETAFALVEGVITAFIQLVSGDWEGFGKTMDTTMRTAWNGIQTFIDGIVKTIANLVALAMNGTVEDVKTNLLTIKVEFETKFGEVVDFVKSLPDKFVQFGRNVIQGFIDGMNQMGEQLKAKIYELIPEPVRKILGVASPSKLMHYFGEMSFLGYMGGWQDAHDRHPDWFNVGQIAMAAAAGAPISNWTNGGMDAHDRRAGSGDSVGWTNDGMDAHDRGNGGDIIFQIGDQVVGSWLTGEINNSKRRRGGGGGSANLR